jgi:hypothetical protein
LALGCWRSTASSRVGDDLLEAPSRGPPDNRARAPAFACEDDSQHPFVFTIARVAETLDEDWLRKASSGQLNPQLRTLALATGLNGEFVPHADMGSSLATSLSRSTLVFTSGHRRSAIGEARRLRAGITATIHPNAWSLMQ